MDARSGLQRLMALLSMMPDPQADAEAWDALWRLIDDAVGGPEIEMDFWKDKLAWAMSRAKEPDWDDPKWLQIVDFLASLPITCFDVDGEPRRKLECVFDRLMAYKVSQPGAKGRRWLDDLLSTAWDVQVALRDVLPPESRPGEAEKVREFILAADARRSR